MSSLNGKTALVTGASRGIGRATALLLAARGAQVLVHYASGAKEAEAVVAEIRDAGGRADTVSADLSLADGPYKLAQQVRAIVGDRLDILVANAGVNIPDRDWTALRAGGADEVIHGNLSSAFYCAIAVLPMMRRQQDGLLIHTASMAGRFIGGLSGAAYTAAKHGVVAMSHSLNMQECVNGIRSSAVLPGEVATPILDKRPVPVSAEDRAKMLQSADVGDLIRYIACLPKHVCLNEVMITPSWNRGYVADLKRA